MILIDSKPIRDRARREYQKALRQLELARQELEQFEQHDKPHFSRWLNHQFGALLTEIRETSHRLAAQRELLFEVENEAFMSGCSYTRAYERVMRRREAPVEPEPASESNGGPDPFEEFFAGSGQKDGRPPGDDFHEASHVSSPSGPTAPRLKELYRALARRLHPDAQEQMSAQKKEWWHQAQAAYEQGDVEQLQVILTLCEIEEEGTTARTSVSLLTRITREIKSSLTALKRQLLQHRRDPAWRFGQTEDREALGRRIERLLQAELDDAKRVLATLDAQIATWARQARNAKARRSTIRRQPDIPEFPF